MKHYYMEHGVIVTHGSGPSCHMAVFTGSSVVKTFTAFKGRRLNTNGVEPFPVVNSFKEITEVIDGAERTSSFSPDHVVQLLDTLNWAGFCYLEKQSDSLPIVIFAENDHYIDLNFWEEISTQKAIELINQYTIPKKEEEDAA